MYRFFFLTIILLMPVFAFALTIDTPSIYIQNPSAGVDVDVPGTSINVDIPDVSTITAPDIDIDIPRIDVPTPDMPTITLPQQNTDKRGSLWERMRSRRDFREDESQSAIETGDDRYQEDDTPSFFSRMRGFLSRFFRRD
ncbi:MAG TPA: hypothetical protein VJL38_02670 [Patescibacteria group bacterium]|nr:hypothetical protein [Patescibacteria group bacterium]